MFPFRDHNPSTRWPFVTWALIAANVAVWLWGLSTYGSGDGQGYLYFEYGLIPARFWAGQDAGGLFTSMFFHAGVMHLAGNMLFLFIFGDNLEDEMGHLPFLAFYIAAGVLSALAQALSEPSSTVPMVGASGAIAGVMGGYLLLFPKARVDVLLVLIIYFRVIPVPAWIMLGLWFALQLGGGFTQVGGAGGTAYWAHAGGFIAGFALTLPLWLRLGGTRFWDRTHGHPPHPEARYDRIDTRIPRVRRK